MYSCTVSQNTDVWDKPYGQGQKVGIIRASTEVLGQAPFNGWVELFLSVAGHFPVYTKASFLPNYSPVDPPPPPPPPIDQPDYIDAHFPDGRTVRYVPE